MNKKGPTGLINKPEWILTLRKNEMNSENQLNNSVITRPLAPSI